MGKAALPYKRGDIFYAPPDDVFIPGVDSNDEHPLTDVNKFRHSINEKMVRNLMAHGAIQPIVVTKEGDKVTVVAGRRRLLHLRAANKRLKAEGSEPLTAPCIVRRGDAASLYGVFISENEHRLSDTILGRARKAEHIRQLGRSNDEIADDFGVSSQTVRNWGKILELDPRVLKLIEEGKITELVAIELHGLPSDEQYKLAQEAISDAPDGKRPTRKQMTSKVDPDAIQAPAKKVIKQLVSDAPEALPADFLLGVQWARGLLRVEDLPDEALGKWLEEQRSKPAKRKN